MSYFVGQHAEITRRIDRQDIQSFAELSGDTNPLHLNADAMEGSGFSGQICHGFLVASYISAVLGTQLPGPGTIYMGQTLSFRKPVYVGDTVTAKAQILSVNEKKAILTLGTTVTNQKNETVIEGEATVKVLKHINESVSMGESTI